MKQILKEVIFFSNQHLSTIFILIIPYILLIYTIGLVIQYNFSDDDSANNMIMLYSLLSFAMQVYYMGIMIKYLHNVHLGTQSSTRPNLNEWLTLLFTQILYGFITVIGLFCFILPGLFFSARFSLCSFFCLLHQQDPVDSLKSSWNASRDYFWQILFGVVLIMGIYLFISYPLSQFQNSEDISSGLSFFIGFIVLLLSAIQLIFLTIFTFRIYTLAQQEPPANDQSI